MDGRTGQSTKTRGVCSEQVPDEMKTQKSGHLREWRKDARWLMLASAVSSISSTMLPPSCDTVLLANLDAGLALLHTHPGSRSAV